MSGETMSPYTARNRVDAAAAIREGGVLISVTPEDYHEWREEIESAESTVAKDAVPDETVLEK